MAPPSEPTPQLRVVTIGPFDDDWAVVDYLGQVIYVGHAIHCARMCAQLSAQA